jgi:post-segregation antitoxin (ccd killing protein)
MREATVVIAWLKPSPSGASWRRVAEAKSQAIGRVKVIALRLDMDGQLGCRRLSYRGRIDPVAKLSVSLPDDLVRDLRAVAHDNVSAFVAAAVRHELDRRRLHAFVEELVTELGPSDEAEVVRYSEMFAASAAAAEAGRTASS